jgi:hypothetical protein
MDIKKHKNKDNMRNRAEEEKETGIGLSPLSLRVCSWEGYRRKRNSG